ncbi:MAG TPA: hypothetical protein VF599_20650, partial [Pyrinomonadaceae bacterium]
VGFCIVCCGISSLWGQQRQNTATYDKSSRAQKSEAGIATVSSPFVIQLKSLSSLNGSEQLDDRTVRLTVRVRQPDLNEWSGFRVFLNLPENKSNPSPQEPYYVGRASFYGGKTGEPVSFMFNLGKAINSIKQQTSSFPVDEPLTVTIVPVASSAKNRVISDTGLVVKNVNVELSQD